MENRRKGLENNINGSKEVEIIDFKRVIVQEKPAIQFETNTGTYIHILQNLQMVPVGFSYMRTPHSQINF